MRIPLTLFLILIWTFLILAPLNAYAEEVDYPYAEFKLQDIYQIDDGKTIYIEQTGWGHTIWGKDKSSRELNKLGSFAYFYGIAKECHAYKDNEFNNIVFASSKEYYYGGGINEFPIRMYHLHERNAHVSYRTDIGMVMNMNNTSCTFYETIDP